MNIPIEPDQVNSRERSVEALVVGFIILSIIEAEAATTLVAPLIGIVLFSAIILTVINIYLLIPFLPHRKVLLSLLLLPILRLISFTVPIAQLPQLYWYAAIGIPLLISVTIVTRITHPPLAPLRFRFPRAWGQIAFGLTGIPLAIVAYRYFPQRMFLDASNWRDIFIGAVSITIFSAFTEEIIFRYLIQTNLEEVFRKSGIWIGSVLYASFFLSTKSLPIIVYWGLVGLIFSFWAKRTNSIWGPILAHSLILIGATIIFPIRLQ